MYVISFICCNNNNIFLSCLKINSLNINKILFAGFSKSHKNILIKNFIDNKIGNVKLYKSKKRLELRLNINILKNSIKIY